jgi:streptogramin lyase
LNGPGGIAIDGTGNAWVADFDAKSVIKLSNSGTILSGASGFTAGGSTGPSNIAIDTAGNAWVSNEPDNTVTELSNSGTVLSGGTGYNFGGQVHPSAIAIDASGKVWFVNLFGGAAFKLNSDGSLLSPAAGYPSCVSTFPPLLPGRECVSSFSFPQLAIDGSGNIWGGTVNDFLDSNGHTTSRRFGLAELNNSGTIISGPSGYVPTGFTAIAVDGSGNVWTDSAAGNNVTELIGVAAPVVTPLSVGVKNGTLGQRP